MIKNEQLELTPNGNSNRSSVYNLGQDGLLGTLVAPRKSEARFIEIPQSPSESVDIEQKNFVRALEEGGRWRGRNVRYLEGSWDRLRNEIPLFRKDGFRAHNDAPPNPHFAVVVRCARKPMEFDMPVGLVSRSYTLVQHRDIGEICMKSIREAGIKTSNLKCQLGLTELGEWMNMRMYFPETFDHIPADGHRMQLRLECCNSVDGSGRLTLFLSWLRLVCTNGLMIRETRAQLNDIHNQYMDVDRVPKVISEGLMFARKTREVLLSWEHSEVTQGQLATWVDEILSKSWGKKAACRAFHICTSGYDVVYENPFSEGKPTTKAVKRTKQVPGSPPSAKSLYDVSQALSWIASSRSETDGRVNWQSQIFDLIEALHEIRS